MRYKRVAILIVLFFVIVLLIIISIMSAHYQQTTMLALPFAINPYDLSGDGLVTEADLIEYNKTFDRLNFNGDSQIDIFDQSLIAYAAIEAHKIYLPVVYK